jgi:hypothetical protein
MIVAVFAGLGIWLKKRGSGMGGISFGLFLMGAIFLAGMAHHIVLFQKRRIYPPRKRMKQRIKLLGGAGILLWLLAIIFLLF